MLTAPPYPIGAWSRNGRAALFLWHRRQSVRWLYVWLPFLLTSTAAFHPREIASRRRIDEARRVQLRRPASRRTFCVSANAARLELIAGRSGPDAKWHQNTLHRNVAHAHTTKVVTIDVWLESPRRPLVSKAQRRNTISTNVVAIASTPATKDVTRCAVSTKVVAQWTVAARRTVAVCKVEDLFIRRDHVTAHRMAMCSGSHKIS